MKRIVVDGVEWTPEAWRVRQESLKRLHAGEVQLARWNRSEVLVQTSEEAEAMGFVKRSEVARLLDVNDTAASEFLKQHVIGKCSLRHCEIKGALYLHAKTLQRVFQQSHFLRRNNKTKWMQIQEAAAMFGMTETGARNLLKAKRVPYKRTYMGWTRHLKKVYARQEVEAIVAERERYLAQQVPRGWEPVAQVARRHGISRSAIGRYIQAGVIRYVTIARGPHHLPEVYVEPNAAGKYLATKVQEVQAQLDELIQRVKRAMGK